MNMNADEIKIVEKTWGHEAWIENNSLYCCKIITIYNIHGWSSKGRFHYHKKKDETFFILGGDLAIEYYDGTKLRHSRVLLPGAKMRITRRLRHRFMSMTPETIFIECSTHHEDEDSYYEDNSS